MQKQDVKRRIEEGLAGAEALVSEFSGGDDHYAVVVIAREFEGKMLLKRHRMVLDLFQSEIATGEVHALTIKAYTPEQWVLEKPKQLMF